MSRELLERNFPLGTTERPVSLSSLLPDTTIDSVSTEGFADAIGTFFSDMKRNRQEGKKPKSWKYNISHVRDAIRMYYTNDEWLAKRRFITKEVILHEFTPYLMVNNRLGTIDEKKETLDTILYWFDVYLKELDRYMKRILPIAQALQNEEVNDETLRRYTEKVNAIPRPENVIERDLERRFRIPLGNRIYRNRGFSQPVKTTVRQVPPLTKEDVIENSALILDYLNKMDDLWGRSQDILADKRLNFAADKNWHGYIQINEYLYGKHNAAQHLDTINQHQLPEFENPWLNMGSSIFKDIATNAAKDLLTDEQRGKAWMALLVPFKGRQLPLGNKLKDVMYSVVRAEAYWIDASFK